MKSGLKFPCTASLPPPTDTFDLPSKLTPKAALPLPSLPISNPISASSSGAVALKATAPAPSPKRTHVLLSDQSNHPLKASAPITIADLVTPLLKYCDAVTSAKTKPEQAAVRSMAAAFFAPNLCAISVALPKRSSAVDVARIINSTSSGSMSAASMACFAAATEREVRLSPGPAMQRVRMPVRCVIHSSLVSTISDKSSLLTMASGTAFPVPAILIPATAPVSDARPGAARAVRTTAPVHWTAFRNGKHLLRADNSAAKPTTDTAPTVLPLASPVLR
mmetsp:Transcript_5069/g.12165  ORF Transcript_5069/g.12165 Transcript_5069/m.12165 type:complete len:278 (-) Transcript_5069:195-1028(-)